MQRNMRTTSLGKAVSNGVLKTSNTKYCLLRDLIMDWQREEKAERNDRVYFYDCHLSSIFTCLLLLTFFAFIEQTTENVQ